jgi:biopolymer transport protein ExbD
MIHKSILICLFTFFGSQMIPQASTQETQPFYVNIFINAEETYYVETERTEIENIEQKVSEIVRKKPFRIDQQIVHRIFADKNLPMAKLIDLDQKLQNAYSDNIRRERYLLNTVEMNIDGKNWFESIDMNSLK